MISVMAVPCHWALSPTEHKIPLQMLIISHLQPYIALSCECDGLSMTLAPYVDLKQVNLL